MIFMVENIYSLNDSDVKSVVENIRENTFETAKKHEEWYKSAENKKNKSMTEIKINGIVNGYLRQLYNKEELIERLKKCLKEADNFKITAGGHTFNLMAQITDFLYKNDTNKNVEEILKSISDIHKKHPGWKNSTNENKRGKFEYLEECIGLINYLYDAPIEEKFGLCNNLYNTFIEKNTKIHKGKSIWKLLNNIRYLCNTKLVKKEQFYNLPEISPEAKLTVSLFQKININTLIEYNNNNSICFDVALMCLYLADATKQLITAGFKQVVNVVITYSTDKTEAILIITDISGNNKEVHIPFLSGNPENILFASSSLTSLFGHPLPRENIINKLQVIDNTLYHMGIINNHFIPLIKVGAEWFTWQGDNGDKIVALTTNNGQKLTEYALDSFKNGIRVASMNHVRQHSFLDTLRMFRKNIISEEQAEKLNESVAIKLVDTYSTCDPINTTETAFLIGQSIEREQILANILNKSP